MFKINNFALNFCIIFVIIINVISFGYIDAQVQHQKNGNCRDCRRRSVIWLRSIPGVWIATNELYEQTMEGIEWLIPINIQQYNVFSPQSSYQINLRYRNNPNVQRYYGYQLWKIHETNLKSRKIKYFWKNFATEVWNINQDGIDILIEQKDSAYANEFLKKNDLTYNVMINDIERAIDETYIEVQLSSSTEMPWLASGGTSLNWQRFHDISDIQQFLQHIQQLYPARAQSIQIGVTYNKQPLTVLRISNGDPNNFAIFVDGGLQARDWLSPAAITYAIAKLSWLWDMKSKPAASDEQLFIMENIDWYFLPVANPDGYQHSRTIDRLWTKNRHYDSKTGCYGVNIERNFAYQWGGAGSSENPCTNLYHGKKSFSELETKAMRLFLENMKDYLGAYISIGGYGQTVTYPWGDADYVTMNYKNLHKIGRQAVKNFRLLNHAEYSVGSSYRMTLARAGNSVDWVQQRIHPKLAYNIFLKDQGRYGYLMPPNYIVESGEEVYEFLQTIATALIES